MALEDLTKSVLDEQLNTKFRVSAGDSNALEVELIEITGFGSSPENQFSIVFRGPHDPLLPQSIYKVEHDQLGASDIFLVPIRKDKDGLYYEAIFNRASL